MSHNRAIIGWDLGGAHLKVALLDENGVLRRLAEHANPLWQGLQHLDRAIDAISADFPLADCDHYLTMTGELVDLFDDRVQGVVALTECMRSRLPAGRLRLYAGPRGFVDVGMAGQCAADIASANWHATAAWVAAGCGQGLLIDVGSTTSDVLSLRDGRVDHRGYGDRERLACDELIYHGVVRTPVMAVVQRVPFAGDWSHVANEHFATQADVYRILGWLPADADLHPSADGRDKSVRSSMRRLSRMVGTDLDEHAAGEWQALAGFIADRQLDALSLACQRHFSRGLPSDAPLIGAGVGAFLVQRLAHRLGRSYIDVDCLAGDASDIGTSPAVCAPAVALARLAERERLACPC